MVSSFCIKRITCLLNLSYLLNHKQDMYTFCLMHNISRVMVKLFFWSFFSHLFFGWIIYFFPILFNYKSLIFCYFLWVFFDFFMISQDCCSLLKAFIIFLLMRFVAFLFFTQSGGSLFIPSTTFKIYFITFVVQNKWTEWNMKSLLFIDVSNTIWDLESSALKGSSNLIFIISHDFYVVTLQVHYTLWLIIVRKHKVSCCR